MSRWIVRCEVTEEVTVEAESEEAAVEAAWGAFGWQTVDEHITGAWLAADESDDEEPAQEVTS